LSVVRRGTTDYEKLRRKATCRRKVGPVIREAVLSRGGK